MNKCYLPTIEFLKKEYENNENDFIEKYKGKDCFIGSSESISFVEKILNEKKS